MPQEGYLDRLDVVFSEWKPKGTEADEEFFKTVVPRLREIKEARLRRYVPDRPPRTDEQVQRSLAYLEDRLKALRPGDAVPLASADGAVVGYLLARWDEGEKRVQLEQFYVDQKYQSRGIGTRLLGQALQHARGAHTEESQGVFLTTDEINERAQYMYRKEGFEPSGTPAKDPGEIRVDLDFKTP